MRKNVFVLVFAFWLLSLPLNAMADKLPGPFPWGMEKGDILADMQAANFTVDENGVK